MRFLKILLVISLMATCIIYLNSRKWELDLIAGLQDHRSLASVYFFQVVSDTINLVSIGIPVSLLIVGIIKRRPPLREQAFLILFSLALAGLFSYGIKKMVREPRPYEVDRRITQLSGGGGFGFPSGHSVEAAAAAAAFSLLWTEWYVMLASFGWVALIMISRIYLGVHDPGDVFAGMFIGILSAIIIVSLRNFIAARKVKGPS